MRFFAATIAMMVILAASSVQASVGWTRCNSSFPDEYYGLGPSGAVAICRADTLAISYDPIMICPAFAAYYLDWEKEENLLPGRKSFYEDPDLKSLGITQASDRSDAFNSSWNRGHLAPSHALSWTADTKYATYTMANIAPQAAIFNQQPWNRLETSIISWVTDTETSLHIITGVGYKDRKYPRRTYDGIAVPDYYWKVLCDTESKESAGWWGPNEEGKEAIQGPVSVRDIQDHYYGVGTDRKEGEPLDNRNLFSDDLCKIDHVKADHWDGISGPALENRKVGFNVTIFNHLRKLKIEENKKN